MGTPLSTSDTLEVRRQTHGAQTILALAGELDMATAPRLIEAFEAVDRFGSLVLDLADLTFIDSHGVHAIFRRASVQHDLTLARPNPLVARVLALAEIEHVACISETIEDALGASNGKVAGS